MRCLPWDSVSKQRGSSWKSAPLTGHDFGPDTVGSALVNRPASNESLDDADRLDALATARGGHFSHHARGAVSAGEPHVCSHLWLLDAQRPGEVDQRYRAQMYVDPERREEFSHKVASNGAIMNFECGFIARGSDCLDIGKRMGGAQRRRANSVLRGIP